ncbi:MAG: mannosyltransferase [Bacteroidetes bacterium RIFOXYA12_FULL_35_11]|nr:MAG: mannosyltransferase [Bacteroidetes bacterium GWF2_35_48]OFY80792.1 MAG: mannosyltransferase [Bacteroidetes bacterium RIFOXYA12_FULL_35_11]OFY97074.1 MAG: mannosyltransferase [Bacteroidetes bacterium RIFOXYB2_FULL_35_7]
MSEVLVITSYPPRECGIATYSQDLIKALNNKFNTTLTVKVCAVESYNSNNVYPEEVKYVLNSSVATKYGKLALKINSDLAVKIVLVQHEFGFFKTQEQAFLQFLFDLSTPISIVFHTVLPHPDENLKNKVKIIADICKSIIVMTHNSADILMKDYDVSEQKISVIAHGTHLVPHLSEQLLKVKYDLTGRSVLTTFGLLSSGKSIETTLNALPTIIKKNPEVIFLIIGKTHPEVQKEEGEKYREKLEQKVDSNNLRDHVIFINKYLALPDLLEYLQLTDIYLFTTNDPNQAVSGTFAYAMSCACPIISTPIPHAKEFLTEDKGIIFDFCNSDQLAAGVIRLLNDNELRRNISLNTLQNIVSTSWENSAVAHAMLFGKIVEGKIKTHYKLPVINLEHLKHLTTQTGIIQFSKINQPDIESGYTLDDNARALIAACMYFEFNNNEESVKYIHTYLNFIEFCQQTDGSFFNYVDKDHKFTDQNKETNLDDANGRAIWALGYLISLNGLLPVEIIAQAKIIIEKSLKRFHTVHSTRAMAFAIKGIYYYYSTVKSSENFYLLKTFADRLVQMYKHESNEKWEWYEAYLTYANSVLPEAMLYAWLLTDKPVYKDIAISSLNFLLAQIFNENGIEVISNKHWLQKGETAGHFGEQPIDVAYTIMTLNKFRYIFMEEEYKKKMEIAFNWFLGNNRLHHIVYNPCTGGCYDGLEEKHVNLNQGAESTISYLMARLTMEKYHSE